MDGLMHVGEWDWNIAEWLVITIVMVLVLTPLLLTAVFDLLLENFYLADWLKAKRISREMKNKSWNKKWRRCSDRLKTFLAFNVRDYDD